MNPQGQVIYPKAKPLDIQVFDDGFKLETHNYEVKDFDAWWLQMGEMVRGTVRVSGQ